jgi:hypothetical protein
LIALTALWRESLAPICVAGGPMFQDSKEMCVPGVVFDLTQRLTNKKISLLCSESNAGRRDIVEFHHEGK